VFEGGSDGDDQMGTFFAPGLRSLWRQGEPMMKSRIFSTKTPTGIYVSMYCRNDPETRAPFPQCSRFLHSILNSGGEILRRYLALFTAEASSIS
jgi:hypothetical protein